MLRKSIYVVIVLVLVGGALYVGIHWDEFTTLAGINNMLGTNKNAPVAAPAAQDTVVVFGPAQVTEINAYKLTAVDPSGTPRTFSIPQNIPVYSLAYYGQTGKGYSDIAVGTNLMIYPNVHDSNAAAAIAFVRDPSLVLTQAQVAQTVNGIVTAISSTTVTVNPASGTPVVLTLDPSTKIVTTVLGGQQGRNLAIGDSVSAGGITTKNGTSIAYMILLSPIFK